MKTVGQLQSRTDLIPVRDNHFRFLSSPWSFQLAGGRLPSRCNVECLLACAHTAIGACFQCCGVTLDPRDVQGRRSDLTANCKWEPHMSAPGYYRVP